MMSAILSGDLLLSCAGDARGLLCQAHRSAVAATCSAFKHFQEAGALSFEGTAAVTSTLLECGYAAPEGVKKLSGCSFHLRVFFFFLSFSLFSRQGEVAFHTPVRGSRPAETRAQSASTWVLFGELLWGLQITVVQEKLSRLLWRSLQY